MFKGKTLSMKTNDTSPKNNRRDFVKKGIIAGAMAGVSGISLLSCGGKEEEEVTPTEDLMREHGVLTRILFIYDTCRSHLLKNEDFPMEAVRNSAQIIRSFVENYHEKLEEEHLFPRFQKANQMPELVNTLIAQHHIGRLVTNKIEQISKAKSVKGTDDAQKLANLLEHFNTMYRPHHSREDTVLFPALKKIVSEKEYRKMGDDFEKLEQQLFGKDGFETMVDKVASIEKQLGINDLNLFTPKLS